MAAWYRWDGDDLVLSLHVQPGAQRDALAGPHGDRLKVRVRAPASDGRANRRLIEFLAGHCGVPRSSVSLLSGAGARFKRVRIRSPRRLPDGVAPRGDPSQVS